MGEKDDTAQRARYTLEFKLEAVRLVKGGQDVGVTAKILGMPKQTLGNWVRLSEKGQLRGAGDKPVSSEQMELARLRAEMARVKMERDILKNRPRGLPRPRWIETRSA
jgi:transposase-like protein